MFWHASAPTPSHPQQNRFRTYSRVNRLLDCHLHTPGKALHESHRSQQNPPSSKTIHEKNTSDMIPHTSSIASLQEQHSTVIKPTKTGKKEQKPTKKLIKTDNAPHRSRPAGCPGHRTPAPAAPGGVVVVVQAAVHSSTMGAAVQWWVRERYRNVLLAGPH